MSQRQLPAGLPRLLEAPLAAVGLVASAPALLLAMITVRLTSSGPAVFRQQRIGRHGRPFTLYKLRSMRSADGGPKVTSSGDARITPVGRWLRKTKLDELPELWNVLVGDMSFVGPRPEVTTYVDLDQPLWRRALEARPGLTDPVTLALRNEEELLASVDEPQRFYRQHLQPYKLRGYVRYLEQRSATSDVVILLKTLVAVVLPSRAPNPSVEDVVHGRQPTEGPEPRASQVSDEQTGGRTKHGVRRGGTAINLLLLTASMLLAIGLCELVARTLIEVQPFRYISDDAKHWNLDNDDRRYALTPNYRGRLKATEFDVRIAVNSLGLRGPEPTPDDPRPKVFAIGDSFTFGVGVEAKDAIPARIEHHLDEHGIEAAVWNLGVPGYALPEAILSLERYVDLRPTVIALFVYAGSVDSGANDVTGTLYYDRWRAARERSIPAADSDSGSTIEPPRARRPSLRQARRWLERRSALYNTLLVRLGPQLRAWRSRARDEAASSVTEAGWAAVERWLMRLRDVADEHDLPVVMTFIPEHPDLINDRDVVAPRLQRLAEQAGFTFVDGFELLRQNSETYYPLDGHLNAKGYDLMAQAGASNIAPMLNAPETLD